MIIEDKHDISATIEEYTEILSAEVEMMCAYDAQFQKRLTCHKQIKDREFHFKLRDALIEHLWSE